MPRRYPGSPPGVDPRSQGMIPRRFKRKKIFVTDGLTEGRTDRRDGRNSYLDFAFLQFCKKKTMKILLLINVHFKPTCEHFINK